MPPPRQPPDPLHDLLEEAEAELSRRLREACDAEARGVSTEDAEEIRRLEDTLLSAAMAAEQAIAVRRHLPRDPSKETARSIEPVPPADHASPGYPGSPGSEPGTVSVRDALASTLLREFQDGTGRMWRAWPVTPGLARMGEAGRLRLGDFQQGWICFEALDNSGRRRLAGREARWSDLGSEELQQLLVRSIDAPDRKSRRSNIGSDPDSVERR